MKYFLYSYSSGTPSSSPYGDICKISITNGKCKYSSFVLPIGAYAYPVPVTWNNMNGKGTIVVTNTNQRTTAVLNVTITKQCTTTNISEIISNNRNISGCYVNIVNSQILNNATVVVTAERGITISPNTTFKEGVYVLLSIMDSNSYSINEENIFFENNTKDNSFKKDTLLQNFPNPFTDLATIAFCIPENAISSYIQINSIYGNVVKRIPIDQSGENQIQINGKELKAGMYTYSLIVDGKLIDSKRMIVNK